MTPGVKATIQNWLAIHNGDVDGLARWMRDSLHIGGLKACRAMIEEAAKS